MADVSLGNLRSAFNRVVAARPDLVLMAPYLLYLLLLVVKGELPPQYAWLAALIRGGGCLLLIAALWKHFEPWGRADWLVAVPAGVLTAFGWFYGQYFFNWLGVPHTLPYLFPTTTWEDPRAVIGSGALFWSTVAAHVAVASLVVPIVEELFWRSFLLRALIDWNDFEKFPVGTFSLRAMVLTALLSTVQHPSNWLVSIFCWLAWNGLIYWRKSLSCLMITHGVTNLVLYAWVLFSALYLGDHDAWMHLSLVPEPSK